MKKLLSLVLIFIAAFVLISCQNTSSSLVISKVYGATSTSNNVIELYNNSDKDVALNKYSLRFYTNGSETISQTIPLSGNIKSGEFFAIASVNFSSDAYKDLIDFSYTTDTLPYNGNDAIELALNNNSVDFVGTKGSDVDFSKNLTLIRLGNKEDYTPSSTFNTFNFIYYLPDLFEYLKNDNHEIKTLEQLYAGPKLDDRYKTMSYEDPNKTGSGFGGAALVTLQSVADGDTASFQAANGFPGGSVRYFYINTPEVSGGYVNAEPWGYVASKYNKQHLLIESGNKEIRIQSIPDYALNEGYGRNLGLVWINGYLSQFLIVAEGLSEDVGITYQSYDLKLYYKNVPYLTFMRFAEERAKQNGWGVKGFPGNPDGEKSPDWNYTTGRSTTSDPIWSPHLPLPWNN